MVAAWTLAAPLCSNSSPTCCMNTQPQNDQPAHLLQAELAAVGDSHVKEVGPAETPNRVCSTEQRSNACVAPVANSSLMYCCLQPAACGLPHVICDMQHTAQGDAPTATA